VDTGAGGSSLAPLLAKEGYRVDVADSMEYGDFVDTLLVPQCIHLGLQIPVLRTAVEKMDLTEDGTYDVTLCISVIEHVHQDLFETGLRELKRITKPGGYIFLTSDYFRDMEQANQSPYRQIQHTIFTPETIKELPSRFDGDVSWVGLQDFSYKGDFVHNYSFVTVCLQKHVD
jgi:SAM-dependent methyltransferase